MQNKSNNDTHDSSRILMFSQREIVEKTFSKCAIYEFQDIICKIDSVRIIAPKCKSWFKYGVRTAQKVAELFTSAINPGVEKLRINQDYDLFFAFCQFPKE